MCYYRITKNVRGTTRTFTKLLKQNNVQFGKPACKMRNYMRYAIELHEHVQSHNKKATIFKVYSYYIELRYILKVTIRKIEK